MSISLIARWQWVLIGILLGLLIWGTRRWDAGEIPVAGECLNNQETFERQLLSRLGGQQMFKNVAVSRHEVAVDPPRTETIYLVTGKSCDGTVKPDGKYHWEPSFFISHVPYRPIANVAFLGGQSDPQAISRWNSIPEPTVVDFLNAAHKTGQVQFTNAWWITYPFTTWFIGTVLIVGVLWPCVIDLIVYGRLIRPRAKAGVSLAHVRGTTRPAPVVEHSHSSHTVEGETTDAPPASDQIAEPPAVVRPLEMNSPAVAIADAQEHSTFHVKPEDFYPTQDRPKKSPR